MTTVVGALAAAASLVLVLGGCVAAGPSVAPVPATGTLFPPASATLGSIPASPLATPTGMPLPSPPATPRPVETATPRPAATPKPATTAGPTRTTAPTPAPTSRPTPAATAASPVVTLAANNTALHLAVGQEFLLDLGSSIDWAVTVADQGIVGRVIDVLVIQGAQGIYEARAPGTTTLSAVGSPHCTSSICPLYRIAFHVTITVG